MTWVSICISVLSALVVVGAVATVYWQWRHSGPELLISDPVPLEIPESPEHTYFSWEIWSTIGHVGRLATEIKTVVCSLRVPNRSRPVIEIAMTGGNNRLLERQILKPNDGLSVHCAVHCSDDRRIVDMENGHIYVPSGTAVRVSVTIGTGRTFSSKEVTLGAAPTL
jgi:hypothetical protein